MRSTEETRALAQETWDYIHEHPEQHCQTSYFDGNGAPGDCGTTMCVAGTATWLSSLQNGFEWQGIGSMAHTVGRNVLGLTEREAYALFYEFNEERAVQKLKKVIVGEDFDENDYKIKHSHTDTGAGWVSEDCNIHDIPASELYI